MLGADWIIAHGGNNGSILETIRQIGLIGDNRIVIENKPKIGLRDETCVGWSPADFRKIADAGRLHGFVSISRTPPVQPVPKGSMKRR